MVVFARAYAGILWAARTKLKYKLYALCLACLWVLVALSWSYFRRDYTINELLLIISNKCLEENNDALSGASEITKASSSAAATLITLLPALLVFGPFPTARIDSLILFSTSAALLTAGLAFGLATSNVKTLRKHKIYKVVDLCTEETIRRYGHTQDPGLVIVRECLTTVAEGGNNESIEVSERARTIADDFYQIDRNTPLQQIWSKALKEEKRSTRIWISAMIFEFFLIQASLLYLPFFLIPELIEVNIFWLCAGVGNNLIVWWLGTSVILAGIIRSYAESSRFSKVKILDIHPLSSAFEPCTNCESTDTPPVPARAALRWWCEIGLRTSHHFACLPSLYRRLWIAQRSHHGLVVVLRPSEVIDTDKHDTRQLLYGIACGILQAVLLILLTALFGSTYLSSILLSKLSLASFIIVMVASRTYSIYFCFWKENALGTIAIEYGTPEELTAMRKILLEMPSVVINNLTDGCKYAAGSNLAPKPGCHDHTSSIGKPLPAMIGIMTAILSGLVVIGIVVSLFLTSMMPADLYDYTYECMGFVFFFLAVCFVICLVVEKVYSDLEYVETLQERVVPQGIAAV